MKFAPARVLAFRVGFFLLSVIVGVITAEWGQPTFGADVISTWNNTNGNCPLELGRLSTHFLNYLDFFLCPESLDLRRPG